MICKKCGSEFNIGLMCPVCGEKAEEGSENSRCVNLGDEKVVGKKKSKIIAIILLVIFGFFGFHRHYVGKHYTAIIMFAFLLAPFIIDNSYGRELNDMLFSYVQNIDYTDYDEDNIIENTFSFVVYEVLSLNIFSHFLELWIGFDLFLILSDEFTDKYGRQLK